MVRRLIAARIATAGMLAWIRLGLVNPAIQADGVKAKRLVIVPAAA